MFQMSRLEVPRQIVVGTSLAKSLAATRSIPLVNTTLARGEAVVAATAALRLFADLTPVQVKRATASVATALDRICEDKQRALRDSVVPMGDAQRDTLAHVRLVHASVFPQGTDFIRRSMDLQWSELVSVRARVEEPAVAVSIDALGMRPLFDHFLAHVELYGRILGHDADSAGAGEEQASAAWTEAFTLFGAQVLVDYEKDPAIRQELLGPCEAQLEQQRAVVRAAIRRRETQAEAEDAGPLSSEGGAAPPA